MSPYALAVLSLALAFFVQSTVAGIAALTALRPPYRWTTMVLAIGFGLLALHHAFNLELALHTGLFDLRQALLAAGVSLLLLVGLMGLRRPCRSEISPPR